MAENKFEIGQKVIGNKKATEEHHYTKEGYKGTVKSTSEGEYFVIRGEDGEEHTCRYDCFDLVPDGPYTHVFTFAGGSLDLGGFKFISDNGQLEPANVKTGNIYEIKEGHKDECSTFEGEDEAKYIRITDIDGEDLEYDILNADKEKIEDCSCFESDDLVISAQEHMNINTLSEQQKAVLDTNTQALLEAGIIGDNLELKNADYVIKFLFEQNRDAIAKDAAQKIADAKAQAEKAA